MGCGLAPLGRMTKGYCSDGGHNATSIFRDLFTDDINTEACYDVLKSMYLMSTHGEYSLADAAGSGFAKLCMVALSFFGMCFGMAMVACATFLGFAFVMVYVPSWSDLILNSEYRQCTEANFSFTGSSE